ncbi:MATE family efflux transporter [Dongia sp.]|uniref:MATE family efflux transporter n=1 Tax=Dongia sp. TaxID=1977262 RepID=UPI0035AF5B72
MTDITVPLSPALPHRVLALAVPAMLANFSAVLPSLVDTALIGHSGEAASLGGVSIGASLAGFVLWAFAFLRLGTAGFTAQAYGAQDVAEIRATLGRALALAWVFGFVLLLIMVPLAILAIPLFSASDIVADLAARYFHYRLFGAPFELTNYVVFGWLLGLQRVGWALALQVLLNGLNALLSYVLIFHYRLGVDGAAIATAIAQVVTAIAGLYLVRRLSRQLPAPETPSTLVDLDKLFELITVNFDIFIRTLCVMFIMAYFVGLGARMGDATLAANHVLFALLATMAQTLDGFAQSAETLTGQAVGARNRMILKRAVGGSLLWGVVMAALLAILVYAAGPSLLALFSNDDVVLDAAAPYLPWLIASPLIAVWCYILDGVFVGATRSHEMRNSMMLAALGAIIAQYALIPYFGNHGLWAALLFFFALRGITLYCWYPRIARALRE